MNYCKKLIIEKGDNKTECYYNKKDKLVATVRHEKGIKVFEKYLLYGDENKLSKEFTFNLLENLHTVITHTYANCKDNKVEFIKSTEINSNGWKSENDIKISIGDNSSIYLKGYIDSNENHVSNIEYLDQSSYLSYDSSSLMNFQNMIFKTKDSNNNFINTFSTSLMTHTSFEDKDNKINENSKQKKSIEDNVKDLIKDSDKCETYELESLMDIYNEFSKENKNIIDLICDISNKYSYFLYTNATIHEYFKSLNSDVERTFDTSMNISELDRLNILNNVKNKTK